MCGGSRGSNEPAIKAANRFPHELCDHPVAGCTYFSVDYPVSYLKDYSVGWPVGQPYWLVERPVRGPVEYLTSRTMGDQL